MTPQQRRVAIALAIGSEPADISVDDLKAIAEGGIMDPARIYLPAGRLTKAEADARERRILRGEQP